MQGYSQDKKTIISIQCDLQYLSLSSGVSLSESACVHPLCLLRAAVLRETLGSRAGAGNASYAAEEVVVVRAGELDSQVLLPSPLRFVLPVPHYVSVLPLRRLALPLIC